MDIFIRYNDTESIKCVMADKDMVERDVTSEKLPIKCVMADKDMVERDVTSDKLPIKCVMADKDMVERDVTSDKLLIKCVMADKDMVERDVTNENIPGAALQICLFHTLRTFRREVIAEKVGIRSDERLVCLELMQKIAYASGEQVYGELYQSLQRTKHVAALKYFDSNWHGIRELWVEGLKQQQRSFLTRTNNRVESVNQKLKSVITKFSNIVTFFRYAYIPQYLFLPVMHIKV